VKKAITADTRAAILDAAWALMAEGETEVGLAEIAGAAGVSRQTIHLAFGGRPGLLRDMLRRKDGNSPLAARLYDIGRRESAEIADFLAFIEAWLDYLPEIYAVGIQLDMASLKDADAAAAWDDRMKATMLAGMKRQTRRLADAGRLAPGRKPDDIAELAWSLVHPASWRLLVVECGWTAAAFRASRLEIIRRACLEN
jgi:AcrR family transcriptional regulator